ncbi:hypothetical protein R1flu_014695 [Riccia fluitans]|uniref:Uncharacterized protein n=1 Tax=Riccia fluitans TaxID=41844 RepID=A0ABD1YK64_9MARC
MRPISLIERLRWLQSPAQGTVAIDWVCRIRERPDSGEVWGREPPGGEEAATGGIDQPNAAPTSACVVLLAHPFLRPKIGEKETKRRKHEAREGGEGEEIINRVVVAEPGQEQEAEEVLIVPKVRAARVGDDQKY